MMTLMNNLTVEEESALLQAMTVGQLKALKGKGTPIKIDWSDENLEEMSVQQDDIELPHLAILQQMTRVETRNFLMLKNMTLNEKMQQTGFSQLSIETIETDASKAIYGDILRYCKRLGIPKELLLESILEEELV